MIITCPACATQFRVPDGALGSDGRKLRCSSCRHVWFQAPLAPPPEAATQPEPAAPTAQQPEPEIPASPAAAEAPMPPSTSTTESVEAADPVEEPLEDAAAWDEAAPADDTVAATLAGESPPAGAAASESGKDAEAAEETAAAATASGWEPGAVMPRSPRREDAAPRAGLRLVPQETRAQAPKETPAPAAPAYDVTRVVAPDSAPDEKPQKPARKRRSGLFLVLLLLVGFGAVLYFERTQVMRFLPATASLYAMVGLVGAPGSQGLQLHDVAFRIEDAGEGTSSLVISGKVMNVGRDYRLLPELRVLLLDGQMEATESWALRTTAEGLAPGATTVFEAVYADPPRTGSDESIFVTFADLM